MLQRHTHEARPISRRCEPDLRSKNLQPCLLQQQHDIERCCMVQHYFTVHSPSSHLFGKDGLKLGCETEAEAQKWREALREAISNLGTDIVGRHISTDLATRSASTTTFQDSPLGRGESPLGRDRVLSSANLTPTSSPGSEAFLDHSNLAKVCISSTCTLCHAPRQLNCNHSKGKDRLADVCSLYR